MEWNWEAVAGFVGAGILVVAGAIAWWQVSVTRRSTNAQLAVGLWQSHFAHGRAETRRLIYQTSPGNLKSLPTEQIEKIEEELHELDMIGYLVKRRIIERELAVQVFGGAPALRCWHHVNLWISEKRNNLGGGYHKELEEFARFVVINQITNSPRKQWIRFYPGPLREKEAVDLIEKELNEPQLLSTWERRFAIIGRLRRSTCNRELREELLKDKGFRNALIKSLR